MGVGTNVVASRSKMVQNPCVHSLNGLVPAPHLGPVMTPQETAHLRLLRLIENQPEISQRDLARSLGVSVGKTHYLLRALLEKGLVKMNNFRRSDNKLAYAYVLTPDGITARIDLARNFLRYKETEYEALSHELNQLRAEVNVGGKEESSDVSRCAP